MTSGTPHCRPARREFGVALALALLAGAGAPARAAVPPPSQPMAVSILHGYHEGQAVYFVATEASTPGLAMQLSLATGRPVTLAPLLAHVDDLAAGDPAKRGSGDAFRVVNGRFAGQSMIFDSAPPDTDYSPIWRVVDVSWVSPGDAEELASTDQIEDAVTAGKVRLTPTAGFFNGSLVFVQEHAYTIGAATALDPGHTVTLPGHGALYDGAPFVILNLDSSNEAAAMREKINFAPKLANAAMAISQIFLLENPLTGASGSGNPEQRIVLGEAPTALGPDNAEEDYTPLWAAKWFHFNMPSDHNPLVGSDDDIGEATGPDADQIAVTDLGFIQNCPVVTILPGEG
jgi:hypothetical protein